MVLNNQLLAVGARRLLTEMTTFLAMLGVINQQVTIGATTKMMTEEIHQPDLKDHLTTQEEEAGDGVVDVVKVETKAVVDVHVSNVDKKVTWQENVLILNKKVVEAEEVVVAQESATNATKKVIWLESVQIKMLLEKEEEAVEEAEVVAMEATKVAEVVLATNATKRDTLQENARMKLRTLEKGLTRDKEEMKLEVHTEGKVMKGQMTGIMTQEMVEDGTIMLLYNQMTNLGVVLVIGTTSKLQISHNNKSLMLGANQVNLQSKMRVLVVVGTISKLIINLVGDQLIQELSFVNVLIVN